MEVVEINNIQFLYLRVIKLWVFIVDVVGVFFYQLEYLYFSCCVLVENNFQLIFVVENCFQFNKLLSQGGFRVVV